MPADKFEILSLPHLVAILVTLIAPFALAAVGRRSRGADAVTRWTIAIILTLNFTGYGIRACLSGPIRWQEVLPFQLCDWTMIAVVIACVRCGGTAVAFAHRRDGMAPVRPGVRGERWLEVIYFWGIGGSLQAVLTPDLRFTFPDYRFVTFFIDHCGIVIGTAYLMLTRRFRPTLASIGRTWLWSIAYLVVTLAIDRVTGVNYGFLLHKPEAFSILSYLSDWRPAYIFELNLLALVFFAILYAPFAIYDLTRGIRNPGKHEGIA